MKSRIGLTESQAAPCHRIKGRKEWDRAGQEKRGNGKEKKQACTRKCRKLTKRKKTCGYRRSSKRSKRNVKRKTKGRSWRKQNRSMGKKRKGKYKVYAEKEWKNNLQKEEVVSGERFRRKKTERKRLREALIKRSETNWMVKVLN